MGTLYIVATPIGNMEDITLRALETLAHADLILAEDTRIAARLLLRYDIRKPIWRADARTERIIGEKVAEKLESGENVAFVSDAGTPNVSDPGAFLVRHIRTNMPNVKIVPIPGVSAVTAILSVAGISGDSFIFFGYPPHKKGRNAFFKNIAEFDVPAIFYESPHRIEKTIAALGESLGIRKFCVGRELTKLHEEIFWGNAEEAAEHFKGERGKGEFVFCIPAEHRLEQ